MSPWQQETFEQFWAVARSKVSPDMLPFLDPQQELYFRQGDVHVALELYRGLAGVFVNMSVGDGRGWWVRDLHDWLLGRGMKRLYFAAETQTWGRVLMARYKKRGIQMEPIESRPGWGIYYLQIKKEV